MTTAEKKFHALFNTAPKPMRTVIVKAKVKRANRKCMSVDAFLKYFVSTSGRKQ